MYRVKCEAMGGFVCGAPGTIIRARLGVTQGLVEQINRACIYTLLIPCNAFSPKSRVPYRRYRDNNM